MGSGKPAAGTPCQLMFQEGCLAKNGARSQMRPPGCPGCPGCQPCRPGRLFLAPGQCSCSGAVAPPPCSCPLPPRGGGGLVDMEGRSPALEILRGVSLPAPGYSVTDLWPPPSPSLVPLIHSDWSAPHPQDEQGGWMNGCQVFSQRSWGLCPCSYDLRGTPNITLKSVIYGTLFYQDDFTVSAVSTHPSTAWHNQTHFLLPSPGEGGLSGQDRGTWLRSPSFL